MAILGGGCIADFSFPSADVNSLGPSSSGFLRWDIKYFMFRDVFHSPQVTFQGSIFGETGGCLRGTPLILHFSFLRPLLLNIFSERSQEQVLNEYPISVVYLDWPGILCCRIQNT